MSTQPRYQLSPDEYLAQERRAEAKSEYWDGETVAMSGASYSHNLIVANAVARLHGQLRNTACTVLPADMRVRIETANRHVYPDVTVVCGEPSFTDDELDTITNPTLIVEILSKSTKDYDRGDKFMFYRSLPSFAEYLLIDQYRPYVEHHVKQDDGKWLLSELHGRQGEVVLTSIDCRLGMELIYEKLDALPSLRLVE